MNMRAIQSDDIPGRFHQWRIHRLARRLLENLSRKPEDAFGAADRYERNPLLGLEVFDEALVLVKNESLFLNPLHLHFLARGYQSFNETVTDLRKGRPRHTTSPTLRRGGRRRYADCDLCAKRSRVRCYVKADMVRGILSRGFEPPESVVSPQLRRGLSRADVKRHWKEYIEFELSKGGDWCLCRSCSKKA